MKLIHHNKFIKAYTKLVNKLRCKVDDTLRIFQNNPTDRILENHALKGALAGRRAIKVTGDLRIVFREIGDYALVYLMNVGTHNQVY